MPDIDPLLEKHDSISELEADANTAMQSYPSPNAEGRDNGPFYHAAPRQDDQLQDDLNPHPGEHGQLEGPPTPRQGVRAISSAEELQLAAQLSQGLAHGIPMMDHNEEANLQAMAQQEMDQQQQELQQQQQHEAQLDHDHEHMHHDGLAEHHNGLPEPHDGLSHHHDGLSAQDDHVNDHLHEQIHEQPYEHEHDQVMAHAQHDQHLQHDHQHEQPQHDVQHQYMPDQHQHQHLQPAATMESMPSPFHTPDSNIPPRKRSKVSRACDECRRKKVKCDAPSETGDEPCSNCRRSNMQCLFSRIPQKRGPSKGYIKELADRIHSIEGKLASEGANADLSELFNGTRREPSDLFVSTDNSGRKRPYSSISSGDFDTPTPAGHITSNLEHRPVYRSSDDRYRAPYSANELAPAPNTANADADTFARPEVALNGMQVDMDPMDQLPEIDETTFAAYLTVLHPYFPILAANKSRLEAQLARCTPVLREAFITAFHGAIESFPSFNNGNSTTEARSKATRLLAEYDEMNIQRPYVAQLVKLQTLILIVILLDNGIPSPFPGGNGDTSLRYTGLGLAVAQAYQMRLHSSLISDFIGPGVDSDSDENVAIRTWWALIMLDRWHAISLATPKFIPNDMVVILPGLQHLIGESAYHFVRLSNILGHFALVALKSPHTMSFQPDSRPLLDSFFSLSMDLFRELLPATVTPATHPFLHIVYWHCRLLSYTLQTNARSSDILWCCDKLVDLLIGNSQMLNPLNHHFFCITALCLLELNKTDCEREAAGLLLKKLNENQVAPSNWDNIIRDRLAEAVRPSTVHAMEAAASQGLQHLADLATAAEMDTSVKPEKPADTTLGTGNSENTRFSLLPLAQTGYLNALLNSIPNAAV